MDSQDLELLKRRLPLSAATLARNGGRTLVGTLIERALPVAEGNRIRQDSRPLLNKLESSWLAYLQGVYPETRFHPQAMRFKLANGAWYKPDITASLSGQLTCWECKGPKQMKNVARGLLTLKVAAHEFPDVVWILVWKSDGEWKQQRVLP